MNRNGYLFHGGCHGCTNEIDVCPGCQYMSPNWSLPDLNPENIRRKNEKDEMRAAAFNAQGGKRDEDLFDSIDDFLTE